MTKLTPSNINSSSSIPNGSIIKKVDDDNFAEVTQSDITALGFTPWGSGIIDKTETFVAWDNISSWDHVSLSYYREQQLDATDTIKTYNTPWASTTIDYWEAFDRAVSSPIVSIIPSIRLSTLNESWWLAQTFNYSLQLKIYAITGSLWSTAVNTWPALLTSTNTATWTIQFTDVVTDIQFLFDWVTSLTAWQYALKLEWSISWTPFIANGVLRVRWDNTWAYVWNAIDGTTPIAWSDMSFIIETPRQFVVISDADNIDKCAYRWKSIETKNIWENILIKTRWIIAQTWATSLWEMWYLSNTPWEISNTIWTNKVYIGRWYSTDNISIRWIADFCQEKVSYSNISFSWSSQEEKFFVSWWWILNFSSSISLWWSSIVSLSYEISEDNVTWTNIWSIIATSWWNELSQNSISIPSNRFFRRRFSQDISWWKANVTNINLIPF